MKTRTLVLIGVMIIALAAIAMPVMADQGTTLNGNVPSQLSFNLENTSLTFPTPFTNATNPHVISAASLDSASKFASVNISTNDPTWHVTIISDKAGGKLTSGTDSLKYPLYIEMDGAHGLTTSQTDWLAIPATGGSAATFFGNSSTVGTDTTEIPLLIRQVVHTTDPAHTNYAIGITLAYVGS